MKTPRWRSRNRFLFAGATVTAALAVVVAALAAPALARPSAPAAQASTSVRGPGYPPPKGIYAPFINCPLNDPIMHEVMPITDNGGGLAACTAGNATTGLIKIGNITTRVVQPVNVQFGFFTPPQGSSSPPPAVPPLAGPSAILSTKPDLIPESLTSALGCATATDPTIQHICQTAQARGGTYNQVYALAEEAGQISNFALLSWTQPVKFQLINPLLGSSCYIGSDEAPIVLNPSLSLGPGGQLQQETDPVPTVHPDTFVLTLTKAVASDTTFSAPGVIGCGPGGVANVAVDEALDASSGLPAASGNSLTLNGNFYVGANTTSEDSSLTQPQDDAGDLLAAFKASTNGEHSVKHLITMSQFKSLLSPRG